jgi:hypothetical protein
MTSQSRFSAWYRWADRNQIALLKSPGVYAVAVSAKPLEGKAFSWLPEIIYIGMTNSVPGLAGRLRQFENTIRGTRCDHGGADRVRYKHQDFSALSKRLFVAVAAIQCDVKACTPENLRAMGRVAKLEYDCFAEFVARHGALPEFNDKTRSRKFSLTIGRAGSAT